MSHFRIKTIAQVRESFWSAFPQFKKEYVNTISRNGKKYRREFTQNEYCTDIRCAFVDYTDFLQKNGDIHEDLCNKATL